MDTEKAIRALIKVAFENTAATFNDNPTTEAWKNLVDAMWARQALSSPDTMEAAIKALAKVNVGQWIVELRKLHEGKVA